MLYLEDTIVICQGESLSGAALVPISLLTCLPRPLPLKVCDGWITGTMPSLDERCFVIACCFVCSCMQGLPEARG